jgi:hypothetical protein
MPDVLATALPPRAARIAAFVAILVGGAFGGMIGWAFVRLQVSGDPSVPQALGALGGAILGALGVAVVATLVLRAMNEWRTIQHGVNPRTGASLDPGTTPRGA